MLLYASCCSALFGQLKFRLDNSYPCLSISSSLHHLKIASSTSVGTLLGVGHPNFYNSDLLLQKELLKILQHQHLSIFYCLRFMKLYIIHIHEAPLLIIVKYCMSFIPM